ncbi:DUF1499 domain-containing protein [uncultured Lentibacter sp.]|uniref:DUF1499 domain-containing protein n=1 Tax=uncultured Lentibacter sp. TaxID=1659309 RepID=UPI00261039A8|nr:DUF1499 domain-containing protein [uncultured Lentibacter sp.]
MGRVSWGVLGLCVLVVGFAAYVRLAPETAARWRLSGEEMVALALGDYAQPGGFRAVRPYEGDWAAVEAVVLGTPRTRALANWGAERLYVTRSAFWGFPDYTTVRLAGGRLDIYGRLRFGRSDLGVNRGRILGWLARLKL